MNSSCLASLFIVAAVLPTFAVGTEHNATGPCQAEDCAAPDVTLAQSLIQISTIRSKIHGEEEQTQNGIGASLDDSMEEEEFAGNLMTDEEFANNNKLNQATRKSCSSQALLWPKCTRCVPGLRGDDCKQMSAKVLSLKGTIEATAVQRYGKAIGTGGHLYPYLELADFRQRQHFAARVLGRLKPRRILDIGAYFNTLDQFAIFGPHWCPEKLVSVDVVYTGKSYGLPCGAGAGFVTVVEVPMTVQEALHSKDLLGDSFDAVVCIGCDAGFGAKRHQLESFEKPNYVIVEYPLKYQHSFTEYGPMPSPGSQGKVVEVKNWSFPTPPKHTWYGSVFNDRYMKVIAYG